MGRRVGTSLRCGYLVPVHTRAGAPRGRSGGALGGAGRARRVLVCLKQTGAGKGLTFRGVGRSRVFVERFWEDTRSAKDFGRTRGLQKILGEREVSAKDFRKTRGLQKILGKDEDFNFGEHEM